MTIGDFHMHLRLHEEGKKRFQCSTSFMRFVAPSVVKRHMIVHTSNKKFTCESLVYGLVCGKAFKEEATLKRHILILGKYSHGNIQIVPRNLKALHYMLDHYSLHHKHLLNCK